MITITNVLLLLQFGTRFLDIVQRLEQKNAEQVKEKECLTREKLAKEEALGLLRTAQEKCSELEKSVTKSNREKEEALKELSGVQESLDTEKAMSDSLRTEVEKMRIELARKAQEVEKVTLTLEKVEQEANITYNDCVAKFLETQDFVDKVEEKASDYHEIGYKDCLNFVGAGKVVDLEIHSLENFRVVEMARLEREKDEVAEDLEKARQREEGKLESTRGQGSGAVGP